MSEVLPTTDDLGTLTVVFAGGGGPTKDQYNAVIGTPQRSVRVVAADSGAEHARALGLHVDVAVGDFDSASEETKRWLHQSGAEVREFAPQKDCSDLELALTVASEDPPGAIYVVGLGGGRPDHQMLNLLVLADQKWSGSNVFGLAGDCWITVVHDLAVLRGEPGSLVSLVPVGGPACVTTSGLLFALNGDHLCPTSARGLSNVISDPAVEVRVESGVVLAMQPTNGAWNPTNGAWNRV